MARISLSGWVAFLVIVLFSSILILALWNSHRWGNAKAMQIEDVARGLKNMVKDLTTVAEEVSANGSLTHKGTRHLWGIHRTNFQLRNSVRFLESTTVGCGDEWEKMVLALNSIEIYLEDFYASPLTPQDQCIIETIRADLDSIAELLDSVEDGWGLFGRRYNVKTSKIRRTRDYSQNITAILSS